MPLPFLLAGPIIRRVDATSATFWLAFSQTAKVQARVWQGDQVSSGDLIVSSATAAVVADSPLTDTIEVADNLHIALVTAKVAVGGAFAHGSLHSYDISVQGKGGLKALGLLQQDTGTGDNINAAAPARLPLGYLDNRLPTFVTSPALLKDLRFAHASCRKPHGTGPDALAWLDDEIEDSRTDPLTRPQHLFLTGDQIYADDVADCLLPMLTALGEELLGFDEVVPIKDSHPAAASAAATAKVKELPAMRRGRLVMQAARFTSTSASSHLLGFGEFAAMYLAAWSPRVWRSLATRNQLFQGEPEATRDSRLLTDYEQRFRSATVANDAAAVTKWRQQDEARQSGGTDGQRTLVQDFITDVPRVARVLANTPTLMVFDDHEITDDWNLSAPWRTRVITSNLGSTVVRNGLMAYCAFQACGNTPDLFRSPDNHQATTTYRTGDVVVHNNKVYWAESDILAGAPAPGSDQRWQELADTKDPPGLQAFAATEALLGEGASPSSGASSPREQLDKLFGLTGLDAVPKVPFHCKLDGPQHRFVVLDTRTRRTFDSSTRHSPPKLLGKSIKQQLPKGPLTDGRQLLIVVSAAPLLMPRVVDTLGQPLAAAIFDVKAHIAGTEAFDPAHPEPPNLVGSEAYDLEGWAAHETSFNEMVRHLSTYPRVLVLGGDVHFASSMYCDVWHKGSDTVASRIMECTSSAAKNQWPSSIRAALRALRSAQQILEGTPSEHLGWDKEHGVQLPSDASIAPGRRGRLRRKPTMLPAGGWPANTTLDSAKPPDVRIRIGMLRDDRADLGVGAPSNPTLPSWSEGTRSALLQSYAAVAKAHQELLGTARDPVRLTVFGNNVGVVSLTPTAGGDLSATHALLSPAGDGTTGSDFTHHTLDMDRSAAAAPPTLTTGG